MNPKIVERDRILLVGFSFFGDPFAESGGWTEENEIGRLWNRFTAYFTDHGDRIRHVKDDGVAYEVHIESEETAAKGYREVFVGTEVEELDDVPVELLVKILPPATYAVFTLRGEEIASDWSLMIAEWMLGAGYDSAHPYGFQRYDRRFQGLDDLEASELDVYVPIRPAGDDPTRSRR
jgi:predicted transcriptional regulator YdeE